MSNKTKTQNAVSVLQQNGNYVVQINCPVSFSLPLTIISQKFLAIFLRLLVILPGTYLLTFQQIADILGYNDRRDVDNFHREFQKKGCNLTKFLSRKVGKHQANP